MIDVETARTFLAIASTGTFQAAARRVNVTQSTVSARIKVLEARLGQKLFERSKTGADLNVYGRQFERYARAIVQAWEQGKRQVAQAEAPKAILAIGGQPDLWTRFLSQWLLELQSILPAVEMRAVADKGARLNERVAEGSLDIAISHAPVTLTGIDNIRLMMDELVLVTTSDQGEVTDRYVMLDWGEAFRDFHDAEFPHLADARVQAELGYFGIRYVLIAQGACFAPRRLVQPHLDAGYLYEVGDCPSLAYPVFAAVRANASNPSLSRAVDALKDLAEIAEKGQLPPPFWSRSD